MMKRGQRRSYFWQLNSDGEFGWCHPLSSFPATNAARVEVGDRLDMLAFTSHLALASVTLATNRNAADASYNLAVVPEAYNRDVKFADAAKTRGRDAATADRDATVARAAATKKFYLDSVGPAFTYAETMSTVQATHAFDVATAEKTLAYEQVDEVADASTNYNDALTTAADQQTTDRDAARPTWWTAEANAHADLRIASATADRDWSIAILTVDKTRITSEKAHGFAGVRRGILD